jgi:DnaK suppressor protein
MTKLEARKFKKALQAMRNDLLRQIEERRERLALDPANDPMDQVRNVADRDLAVRNVDRMCGVLRLVDRALREIREGTFGVCAHCGEEIPMKRLEAVPWSPNCVACQEQAERRARFGLREAAPAAYALAS